MKLLKSSLLVVGMSVLLTACGGGDNDTKAYNEVTEYPIEDTLEKIYTNFNHYTLYAQGDKYQGWKMLITTQPEKPRLVNSEMLFPTLTTTQVEVHGKVINTETVRGYSTKNPFKIARNPDISRFRQVLKSYILPKTANLNDTGDMFTSTNYDEKGTKSQEIKRTWYLHKVSYNRANLCTQSVVTDLKKAGIDREQKATACYEIDKNGNIYGLKMTLVLPVDGNIDVINFIT